VRWRRAAPAARAARAARGQAAPAAPRPPASFHHRPVRRQPLDVAGHPSGSPLAEPGNTPRSAPPRSNTAQPGTVGQAPNVNPSNPQDRTRANPQDLSSPTGRNPQDMRTPPPPPSIMREERR
jgi:hypothetical protein